MGSQKHQAERKYRADGRRHSDVPEGPIYTPAVDVYESEDEFIVLADIPGAQREDIEVSAAEDEVVLTALVKGQEEGEPILGEYPVGHWHRHFAVRGVDVDALEATVSNGVLKLVMPKAKGARPRKVEIREG